MPVYNYKCDKCDNSFTKFFSIKDRDSIVGDKCDKCEEGKIVRSYQIPNITFDMIKSIPPDLKLTINRLKDRAKLDSIVDGSMDLDAD